MQSVVPDLEKGLHKTALQCYQHKTIRVLIELQCWVASLQRFIITQITWDKFIKEATALRALRFAAGIRQWYLCLVNCCSSYTSKNAISISILAGVQPYGIFFTIVKTRIASLQMYNRSPPRVRLLILLCRSSGSMGQFEYCQF